jgi:hypothetical protein
MKILQVLPRIYLSREQLEASVTFYESLFGEQSLYGASNSCVIGT